MNFLKVDSIKKREKTENNKNKDKEGETAAPTAL